MMVKSFNCGKRALFGLGRMKSGALNKTEKRYSDRLESMKHAGLIAWYRFESVTFKLADDTRYNPDFIVMLANGEIEIHEVKGSLKYIQDDAKVKINVAAEMFPFRFYLIAPKKKKDGGGWEIKEVGNKQPGTHD
jgi:hypothetical protein